MNKTQIKIIVSLKEQMVHNSNSGDWVNCFNHTMEAIKELASKDGKLDKALTEVDEKFEK